MVFAFSCEVETTHGNSIAVAGDRGHRLGGLPLILHAEPEDVFLLPVTSCARVPTRHHMQLIAEKYTIP